MNRYGLMAQKHWARWLPPGTRRSRIRTASSRSWGHGQRNGSTSWRRNWRATTSPGEGYLAKAGRLAAARTRRRRSSLPSRSCCRAGDRPEDRPAAASGGRR